MNWILLLLIVGFLNAAYIYFNYKRGSALTCVVGTKCDQVIRSKHAFLLGVHNALVGMVYNVTLFFLLYLMPVHLMVIKGFVGVIGVISLYLFYLQSLVLKEWCDYCLLAIVINLLLWVFVG